MMAKRRISKQTKIEEEQTAEMEHKENAEKKPTQIIEHKEENKAKKEVKSFVEKLSLWTSNFTKEPLDLMVVLSSDRTLPKCSSLKEYEMYEKIRREYDYYFIISRNDPIKAWKAYARSKNKVEELGITEFDEER